MTRFISVFFILLITLFSCQDKKEVEVSQPSVEDSLQLSKHTPVRVYSMRIGNGKDPYRLFASYPETSLDYVNRYEKEFTTAYLKEFKEMINLDTIQEKELPVEYGQTFSVPFENANVIVFLYERYAYFNDEYHYSYDTHYFDKRNKKALKIEGIFKDYKQFKAFTETTRKVAEDSLLSQVKNQELSMAQVDSLKAKVKEGTRAIADNFKSILPLSNGNWRILFDQGQVATSDNPHFFVDISKTQMEAFLNPSFVEMMSAPAFPDFPLENKEEVKDTLYPEDTLNLKETPVVALTFDDGPSVFTDKILAVLKENDVRATFFVNGASANIQRETLRQIKGNGHEVGLKGWSHRDFTTLSALEIQHSMATTQNLLDSIVGKSNYFLRPPYGKVNETVEKNVNTPIVLWDVYMEDWKKLPSDTLQKKIQEVKSGDILLLHDIYPTTPDILPRIIAELKQNGFHFVKVSSLLGKHPKKGKVYPEKEQK